MNIKINRIEAMEQLLEYMEPKLLLTELVHALSDSEALDNFEFICRINDLEIEGIRELEQYNETSNNNS